MLRSVWAYEHRPRGAVPFFRVRACKKIARGGGAEQYHADKRFKEAAEAAVVACAAEGVPQGAECFICRSSIEGMGIVRGCACRGTMGLAHLSSCPTTCLTLILRQIYAPASFLRTVDNAAADKSVSGCAAPKTRRRLCTTS